VTIDTFILTGVGSGKVDAGRAKRWWVGGASAFQLAVVLAQLPFTPAEAEEVGTKSDRCGAHTVWPGAHKYHRGV